MDNPRKLEINLVPKQVEGEVVEKKTTWADIEASWDNLVQVAKTAIEKTKQKQEEDRETTIKRVTVYARGDVIRIGENTLVIEDMVITGGGQIKITGRLKRS